MLHIAPATEVTDELVEAMAALVPQLSTSSPPPTGADLQAMVDSPATTLFVARDGEGGKVVGTLSLIVFRIPTGVRAWIEDVIVDTAARGRGCGEALNRAAIDAARAAGAKTVDLTSRPSRGAANRLYLRLGFQPRDTNVYRYDLAP